MSVFPDGGMHDLHLDRRTNELSHARVVVFARVARIEETEAGWGSCPGTLCWFRHWVGGLPFRCNSV